eukprot:11993644-Alexandrium_andersonii.AAC.1
MHFLPYHPTDPRLATKSRLDRSDYDALLHVDFRQCQFLNCADFVATQNGHILAEGRIPAQCIRRVEYAPVSRAGAREWRRHK